MASRLILKDIKAPLRFLLRNPASSAPSAQTIQNLLLPIPRQSPSGFLAEVCSNDRSQLSRVLNSSFDGGFRIEVKGKWEAEIEGVDEFSEDENDYDSDKDHLEFFDMFTGDGFGDNSDVKPPSDDEN